MPLSTLTLARPDDLARPFARRRADARRWLARRHRSSAEQSSCRTSSRRSRRPMRRAGYRERIRHALPADSRFEPLMTLYLTDNTSADDLARAKASGFVHAVKYYPAGATTNSESGVTSLRARQSRAGGDGAPRHRAVDPRRSHRRRRRRVRSRARVRRAAPGGDRPRLSRAAHRARAHHDARGRAVRRATRPPRVAATITPQHLLYSRNALFAGGLRPHLYCLPVLKRETHRQALVAAATSGNPKFFLGTDSAPHATDAKEHACGCAGCYSAPIAMPLYAEAFEDAGALDRLEGFASVHGAAFYGLPRNADTITLVRGTWPVPDTLCVRCNDASCRCAPARRCAGRSSDAPIARWPAYNRPAKPARSSLPRE